MSLPWTCRRCALRLARTGSQFAPAGRRHATSLARAVKQRETISPALLERARIRAGEHDKLVTQLSESFSADLAKRVRELKPVASSVGDYDRLVDDIEQLRALLRDSGSDAELREIAEHDYKEAASGLDAAAKAILSTMVPQHPFADMHCLIEIRPGVGGTEAGLFAGDLLQMYTAYCSRHRLDSSLLKYETADSVGEQAGGAALIEAILEVREHGAYNRFSCETGIHRVQRVPATETSGRVHTSVASVLVLPVFEQGDESTDFNDPSSDYYVNPADVKTDTLRARGAGGQHVNTTDSAVRLTHHPTGIVISMQQERNQHKNRENAWSLLRSRIAGLRREQREEAQASERRRALGGVGRTGRSDKVRTYNWSQQRVTDHRSSVTVGQLDDLVAGGTVLDSVMDSVRGWMLDIEVQALVGEEKAKGDGGKKQ